MNADHQMEHSELEIIADFYATIITTYSAQIKARSFLDDEIKLIIADEVNLSALIKQFKASYLDYLTFERKVVVHFQQGNVVESVQIN